MTTPFDVVKRYYPDATEGEASDILWGHTPHPFYRSSTVSGIVSELDEALKALVWSEQNDVRLCDFCPKPALEGDSLCSECRSFLTATRVADKLKE